MNTIKGREYRPQPGGTAYYASMVYQSLGLRTAAVTCVASEDEQELLSELRTNGTEVFNLPTGTTTVFHNFYAAENPDVRMQSVTSVARTILLTELPSISSRIYHLGPLTQGDIEPSIARHCANSGGLVAVDVQGLIRDVVDENVVSRTSRHAWEQLRYVHVLKADIDEILTLTREPNVFEAVKAVGRTGVGEVVITKGSRGSTVFGRSRSVSFEAIPPRATVDTTGCGDTYLAAYMASRLRTDSLEESAKYGALAASLNMESFGPFRGTQEDIQERWSEFCGAGDSLLHLP
ncbi:MAG: PfkB family carbohydrate kinase, partial [Alphaproteobacteria bacterium]